MSATSVPGFPEMPREGFYAPLETYSIITDPGERQRFATHDFSHGSLDDTLRHGSLDDTLWRVDSMEYHMREIALLIQQYTPDGVSSRIVIPEIEQALEKAVDTALDTWDEFFTFTLPNTSRSRGDVHRRHKIEAHRLLAKFRASTVVERPALRYEYVLHAKLTFEYGRDRSRGSNWAHWTRDARLVRMERVFREVMHDLGWVNIDEEFEVFRRRHARREKEKADNPELTDWPMSGNVVDARELREAAIEHCRVCRAGRGTRPSAGGVRRGQQMQFVNGRKIIVMRIRSAATKTPKQGRNSTGAGVTKATPISRDHLRARQAFRVSSRLMSEKVNEKLAGVFDDLSL
ncbi:hypothetical protein QBC34DRAFT_412709 [Podospora aff. communis PSN243]|uniref:Uncharacterized protein n=1 Tax=Podospora aff. communis PSN243 TaxID=3040156 RepID=A0AAV9GEN9_9PEZI|nr:hypothetical protein QBC34DRAFT_412709 [Podospora aff. communis PSN243]